MDTVSRSSYNLLFGTVALLYLVPSYNLLFGRKMGLEHRLCGRIAELLLTFCVGSCASIFHYSNCNKFNKFVVLVLSGFTKLGLPWLHVMCINISLLHYHFGRHVLMILVEYSTCLFIRDIGRRYWLCTDSCFSFGHRFGFWFILFLSPCHDRWVIQR